MGNFAKISSVVGNIFVGEAVLSNFFFFLKLTQCTGGIKNIHMLDENFYAKDVLVS